MAPVRAFFLLGVVATAVVGLVMLTRDAAPSEAQATTRPSPDYSLTDAEAIAEFERLRSLALTAVRQRDLSLVDEVFTTSGPLQRRARREVQALLQNDVVDRSIFTSLGTEIVENTATEITVVENSRLKPCFRNSSGRDVSTGPASIRQIAEWTMRLQAQQWLLHNAVISEDEVLNKEEASCA